MLIDARKERLGWHVSADWWEEVAIKACGWCWGKKNVPRQNFLQGRYDFVVQRTHLGLLMQDDDQYEQKSWPEIRNSKRNERLFHTSSQRLKT